MADLEVYMRKHPKIGGCCGEIIVKDWKPPDADFVDVAALVAQWFEYKMGHVLNKPLEDLMGYIGVLPGAFSCYRWAALNVNNYQVLGQYFRPFIAPHTLPWKLSNIYHLAEDRIMSEEIIKLKYKRPKLTIIENGTVQEVGRTIRKIGYTLGFVKTAKALTEGAQNFSTFIKQRRRWINGGWFAMIKMVLGGTTLSEIRSSGHGFFRKCWLLVELFYLFVVISFTWMSVGAYYLAVIMALSKILLPYEYGKVAFMVLRYIYIFHLVLVFIISLALKPDGAPKIWKYFSCFFAVVSYFLFISVIYFVITGDFAPGNEWVRYIMISVIGIMALSAFLYGEEYAKICLATVGYVWMLPSYINILSIYAICQTDDISWGTRGTGAQETKSNMEKNFATLKTWYLLFYITCNVLFGAGFENISRSADVYSDWQPMATKALQFLYGVAIGVLCFPFCSMLVYLFLRCIRKVRRSSERDIEDIRRRQKLKKEYLIKKENDMKRAVINNRLQTLLPTEMAIAAIEQVQVGLMNEDDHHESDEEEQGLNGVEA